MLFTVHWVKCNRLGKAYFIMWFINVPKEYNTQFDVHGSVFIVVFKQNLLRISTLFPATIKYYFLRNVTKIH